MQVRRLQDPEREGPEMRKVRGGNLLLKGLPEAALEARAQTDLWQLQETGTHAAGRFKADRCSHCCQRRGL